MFVIEDEKHHNKFGVFRDRIDAGIAKRLKVISEVV